MSSNRCGGPGARSAAALGCLLAVLAGGPAMGGEVYLPFAAFGEYNFGPQVVLYTNITAFNTSGSARRLTVSTFDLEGTKTFSQSFTVPARKSFRIGALPVDRVGFAEIKGGKQFLIRADLDHLNEPADESVRREIPVLRQNDVIAAGGSAVLFGLERSLQDHVFTDLTILNLSAQAATCLVEARHADGTPIGTAATITVFAGSARLFRDAFGALGAAAVSLGSFSVSCSRSFFAFALEWGVDEAHSLIVTPARTLDGVVTP
jgi:hypothetical protein